MPGRIRRVIQLTANSAVTASLALVSLLAVRESTFVILSARAFLQASLPPVVVPKVGLAPYLFILG